MLIILLKFKVFTTLMLHIYYYIYLKAVVFIIIKVPYKAGYKPLKVYFHHCDQHRIN